jgi:hypothetical protein
MKARFVMLGALVATGACGCNGLLGIVQLDGAESGDAGLDGAGPGDADRGDMGVDGASADVSSDASDGGPGDGSFDAADALDAGANGDSQAPDSGCFPRPSGLVSWWRAEDTADDSVGPNKGTSQNVTFVQGMVGRAFHFAGNGGVSANAIGLPTGTSERTVEMWVKLDANYPETSQYLEGLFFGYGDWRTDNGSYVVLVASGGASNFSENTLGFSQWGLLMPSPRLAENEWCHVAVTLSAGGMLAIYVNGSLIASNSVVTYPVDTTGGGSVLMGGPIPGADHSWLTGDVDEAAVYTRALAPSEIQGIFNAGSAGKCP